MGKRLEDLNLGDSGPSSRDDLGAARRELERWRQTVQDLVDDEHFEFAWGFLIDLRASLDKADRITEAQIEAVQNIIDGKERHEEQLERWERHEKRTGRRYEGFSGRYK